MMIGGRTGRLNDENIFPTDVLVDLDVSFPIGKGADSATSQFNANAGTNGPRQEQVRVTGKYFHILNKIGFLLLPREAPPKNIVG
jgi:hypothetical protein